MKKYFLAAVAAALLLCSCGNVSDKKISEPLKSKELSKILEKDMDFFEIYEVLRSDKFSEEDKLTFSTLTYKDIFDFKQLVEDTEYWDKKKEKFAKTWTKKYGDKIKEAEEELNHWQQIIDDSKVESYLYIEFVEAYSDGIKFRVKPMKENIKIENLKFTLWGQMGRGSTPVTAACVYNNPIEKAATIIINTNIGYYDYIFNNGWRRSFKNLKITVDGKEYPNTDYIEDMPLELQVYFNVNNDKDNDEAFDKDNYILKEYGIGSCDNDSACYVERELENLLVLDHPLEFLLFKKLD